MTLGNIPLFSWKVSLIFNVTFTVISSGISFKIEIYLWQFMQTVIISFWLIVYPLFFFYFFVSPKQRTRPRNRQGKERRERIRLHELPTKKTTQILNILIIIFFCAIQSIQSQSYSEMVLQFGTNYKLFQLVLKTNCRKFLKLLQDKV